MSLSFGRVSLSCGCLILAASCAKAERPEIWTQFSGHKALVHVQRLVDLGPRTPESEAIVKSRAYIKQELKSSGWSVTEQAFTDNTPRGQVRFVNLIARFGTATKATDLFLLCSDGLTRELPDLVIQSLLARNASLESLSTRLVDAAKKAGGQDNITCVLLVAVPA